MIQTGPGSGTLARRATTIAVRQTITDQTLIPHVVRTTTLPRPETQARIRRFPPDAGRGHEVEAHLGSLSGGAGDFAAAPEVVEALPQVRQAVPVAGCTWRTLLFDGPGIEAAAVI